MRNFMFSGLLILGSCSSNEKPDERTIFTYDVRHLDIKVPESLPDSKSRDSREFQLDLASHNIDFENTELLYGEWIAFEGELKFLNTYLEAGDKVLFRDTMSLITTGWGNLVFNRAAKFYYSESGSHIYDYYIDRDGQLILAQLDFRNYDFTYKEQPEPVYEQLAIHWTSQDQIDLKLNNHIVKLKKKIH